MSISVKNKISGNLAGIRGPKGDKGEGIEKIEKTKTVGLIDTYTITYTNGSKQTYEVKNGEKGEIGPIGPVGPQGQQGIQGETYDDTQIKQDISNHNTRLNTLETDNTQNKQNILSIQQEQINQNSNISQNKTDIELLEENLADEITTEEAENMTVKDAVRWYGKLDVSGNSVQTSRSGKNKFNVSKVSTTITDKIIDTKTGTIQLNVNTDTGANATAVYLCELKPNTSYKIVYNYEGNKAGFGGTINNYLYNETSKTYEYLNNLKKITTNDSGKVQINLIGCQGAIPTINYCKWSGLMLLEETEDETFEEFGAMPSPTIMAEIQNCGCVDIGINNGNILEKGYSTEKENSKFWNTITDNVVTPLSDGWARFEIDNTTGTSARYANAWINLKQFRKNIKANTQYKIIVEFRNIKMDNNDNSSYFCVVGNNVNEIFRGDNKYFRGGILQLKQNIILTSRTQEEINNRKLLLRSFLCAVPGKQVSVECRVSLSKDLNIENYITGESQIITFPLEKNQKLYKGDYLATDGIHHKRKQVRINNTNFSFSMPYLGTFFASSRGGVGLIWDYKNIEGLCTHFKNAHNENIIGNTDARDKLQDNEFNFRNASQKDRVYFKNKAFETIEDWTNFFANNDVLIEYDSIEETIEEYTEEQQAVYNKLQKLLLYKHYNYIECIDEVNCKMKLTYRPDKYLSLQNQIDEIKAQMATQVAE